MTQLEKLQKLHSLTDKMAQSDRPIAQSLMDAFRRWKKLTENQEKFVDIIIARTLERHKPQLSPSPVISGVPIGGFQAIEDLLYENGKRIQWPSIRLETDGGRKIVLRPRVRERAVLITEDGSRVGYVRNTFWFPNHQPPPQDENGIIKLLRELASNPEETAAKYGKKTGNCCFCGLGLTDERSITVGYGPICAGNYGLPWGEHMHMPRDEAIVDKLDNLLGGK